MEIPSVAALESLIHGKRDSLSNLKYQIQNLSAESDERREVLQRIERRIHHAEQEIIELQALLTFIEECHHE